MEISGSKWAGDGRGGCRGCPVAFVFCPPAVRFLVLVLALGLCVPSQAGPDRAFGLDHTPLGQAVLEPGPSGLTVSNIGSGGQDGVRSLLPGRPVTWFMQVHDLTDPPIPDGAGLEVRAVGTVEDQADQPISVLTVYNIGPQAWVIPDFAALGAGMVTVDFHLGPERVLREEYDDPTDAQLIPFEWPRTVRLEVLRFLGFCRVSLGWPHLPGGIRIDTPQHTHIQANEVRIVAHDIPLAMDSLSLIDVVAARIPAFTITEEHTELSACPWCMDGDLNRDGAVNLADFAVVAENWAQCADPLEPACQWSAQQMDPGLERTISVLVCEAGDVYRDQMTRQEFFDDVFPGTDEIGAPDWVHKLADLLWDIFAPPGM